MRALRELLRELVELSLLGLLVGIACWPFNVLDRLQDRLLERLPLYSGRQNTSNTSAARVSW